jgi:hypothetical protein
VVASIVLAYPEKTFNIAKILFKTKEFVLNDTTRWLSDRRNWGISTNEFYGKERIKSCEDKHRKSSLEHLFLNYQLFRSEKIDEKEVEKRRKELWNILDDYYQELPAEVEQSELDKTWRLFLARMDKRKMDITTEKTDEGVIIHFNPEIDPELKAYSEKSSAKSFEPMKYISLEQWAMSKINNDNDKEYKKHNKYENDPLLALQEVKDILEALTVIKSSESYKLQHSDEESFVLFNHSIPAYVCSVLIDNIFLCLVHVFLNRQRVYYCADKTPGF